MSDDYKGIYYNNNYEQQFYEGGAHFKYSDLYKQLLLLSTKEKSKESNKHKKELSANRKNVYYFF